MAFKLVKTADELIDSTYKKSLAELEEKFNYKIPPGNAPTVFIITSRADFDELLDTQTPDWLVGYSHSGNIYLLDRAKFKTEAKHSDSPESYAALLKHELCHIFTHKLYKQKFPVWLDEGIALFLSGQNQLDHKKPEKFTNFLKFVKVNQLDGETVYGESGFVVEFLVNKFGWEKFLHFLQAIGNSAESASVSGIFKEIYGFELNYSTINNLYLNS